MEITPEWSSDSVRRFFDLTGEHTDIMKAANLPPSMVIVQRINMGLFALFGDLHAYGPDAVRFYTKRKTITQRWPSAGVREGAVFSFPSSR